MILDLFIYIIQFYINQNTFLPGFIIRKEATKTDDSELKKKDEIITALKNIIDDYIYPNAANAILRKEGILQIENNIIDNEAIDKQMMNANTNIDDDNTEEVEKENTKSKYTSVNSLLGGFDD